MLTCLHPPVTWHRYTHTPVTCVWHAGCTPTHHHQLQSHFSCTHPTHQLHTHPLYTPNILVTAPPPPQLQAPDTPVPRTHQLHESLIHNYYTHYMHVQRGVHMELPRRNALLAPDPSLRETEARQGLLRKPWGGCGGSWGSWGSPPPPHLPLLDVVPEVLELLEAELPRRVALRPCQGSDLGRNFGPIGATRGDETPGPGGPSTHGGARRGWPRGPGGGISCPYSAMGVSQLPPGAGGETRGH